MQDAKLIQRLFLERGFGGVLAQQKDSIRSYPFTDFPDFLSCLREIVESDSGQVRDAPFDSSSDCRWQRHLLPCAALIFVGDIPNSQERHRRRPLIIGAA